jgi:hypothetical protein
MAPSLAHSVNGLLLALAAGSGFTVPRRMLCYNLLGKQSGDTAVAPQILPSPPGLLEGICGMVAAGEDSGGISTALVPVSVCLCDDHIVKLATGPPLSHATNEIDDFGYFSGLLEVDGCGIRSSCHLAWTLSSTLYQQVLRSL